MHAQLMYCSLQTVQWKMNTLTHPLMPTSQKKKKKKSLECILNWNIILTSETWRQKQVKFKKQKKIF